VVPLHGELTSNLGSPLVGLVQFYLSVQLIPQGLNCHICSNSRILLRCQTWLVFQLICKLLNI